jgi:glyceraldehyde 3-phosphate dehydrogenase
MALRMAIDGFGRIGRTVAPAIAEYNRTDVTVVAINNIGDVETNVYVLKYDSVHRSFRGEVKVSGNTFDIGDGPIQALAKSGASPAACAVQRSGSASSFKP